MAHKISWKEHKGYIILGIAMVAVGGIYLYNKNNGFALFTGKWKMATGNGGICTPYNKIDAIGKTHNKWANTTGGADGIPVSKDKKCNELLAQYHYWRGLFNAAYPMDGSAGHIPHGVTGSEIVNHVNNIYNEMVSMGCPCSGCSNVAIPPHHA